MSVLTNDPLAQGRGRANHIDVGNLLRQVPIVAGVAVAMNLAIYGVAAAVWDVPGEFAVFAPFTVVMSTLVGVAAAFLGWAVLLKLTAHAAIVFRTLCVGLTLMSLTGPYQALTGAMEGLPAASPATFLAMVAMHLVTGAYLAVSLPRRARR